MSQPEKIGLALSGGVDSSVSCRLLQERGYEVLALFMDLGQPDVAVARRQAADMAATLGVDFQVVDLRAAFTRQVKDYFVTRFCQGRTPNPCVVCNPAIKCGLLLEAALAQGCRAMATGHYVRLEETVAGPRLRCGVDPLKDQSYFLCGLKPDQLRHLLFPLGEKTKAAVYGLAADFGLAIPAAESQDVCFLRGKAADYVEAHCRQQVAKGEIVDTTGQVLGEHNGIHRYTIGQRRGLGIPASHPLYVVAIDGRRNRIIVGEEKVLWRSELVLGQVNWLAGTAPPLPWQGLVKIRYRQQAVPARLAETDNGYLVTFAEPQRAVTPGQFAVFYEEDYLLGGGEIQQ